MLLGALLFFWDRVPQLQLYKLYFIKVGKSALSKHLYCMPQCILSVFTQHGKTIIYINLLSVLMLLSHGILQV